MIGRHLQFASYGVGSVGNGIYSTVPGLLLMFYMTNILGVPVVLATIAIFAPKIIDVVTDPIVGSLSDRTRTRWGRRRPYMLVGICSLAFVSVGAVVTAICVDVPINHLTSKDGHELMIRWSAMTGLPLAIVCYSIGTWNYLRRREH